MRETKMALKPYLDSIAGHCDTLSNKELTNIIIGLAKDVPTSVRTEFLRKIQSYLPGHTAAVVPEAGPVEQILNGIQALKENINERIGSIEDGTYWDDPGGWEDDEYYDDVPDYASQDQVEELESFFDDAEGLFMHDRLEDARKVYAALFDLINNIKKYADFSFSSDMDIRESRARYCRCVYETSDPNKRLGKFADAMELDLSAPYNEDQYEEEYPTMRDVIDARRADMENLESFLPAWKKLLTAKGTRTRPAVLLVETVNQLEGISGVSKLARKWKNTQPQGYLFWLGILEKQKDQKGIIRVSTEGLKALEAGRFRERVADFMIDAAEELDDAKHMLLGKRERFFSYVSDQNLADLVAEATKQNARKRELDAVISFFKARKSLHEEKELYVKALLMSGELSAAVSMAKNEKSVGWSCHSSAGVVFGSVLSVLAGHSEKAGAIRTLLKGYANSVTVYSGRFSIHEAGATSFYDEILKGLKQKKNIESRAAGSLPWAEKIGKKRIDHIVSNKHRGAYERAAQVLCCLAEAYTAMGEKSKAAKIMRKYCNEKYNRFSAFRREVKAVSGASGLLKSSGFLK